jgi:hypothetical protein
MRSRYKYEAPSLLKKVVLTIRAPYRWRSRLRPWVFDKKSGVRFQLASDECAALKPLILHMANGSARVEVAVAFDGAAIASNGTGLPSARPQSGRAG